MKRAGRQNSFLEGPTPGAERFFGKTLKPVEEMAYGNIMDSTRSSRRIANFDWGILGLCPEESLAAV
jgi:hypothetical protein